MNWKELKEFCNSLPAQWLEKDVILWREEEAVTKIEAMQLEEDHYVDPEEGENGCFPESDAKYVVESDPEQYPNGMNDLEKAYDKGHPILWEEF
jgi:hypothetical protein